MLPRSLASIFGLFVIFVAAVFTLNLRRSRRQVRGEGGGGAMRLTLLTRPLQEEGLASSSSAHSRPETVYITACVWLFIPAAVTRCTLLFISAFSNRCAARCIPMVAAAAPRKRAHSRSCSDDGLNSVLSIQEILVFDIAAFSFFTFCKLLLSSAIFKYLYSMINMDINRFLRSEGSINVFLVVLVPFFLTVVTSAVLWSYQIFNARASSSPGDMIVHTDAGKNHSAPAPTPQAAADAPSLSDDIYLVSSYHFMCAAASHAQVACIVASRRRSTLSAVIASCCITGAVFVARWKRLRERAPGSSSRNPLGFNSDVQQLAVRLQWVNVAFVLSSLLRLVRCAIACTSASASACACACAP